MAKDGRATEEYLGIVSEWSSVGQRADLGSAYPLYSFSRKTIVGDAKDLFPNPGYVFLLNRGELSAGDFVRIRSVFNLKYQNKSARECAYVCRDTPVSINTPIGQGDVAVLLDVPDFDPRESSFKIARPAYNVTPLFFVRNESRVVFGPLIRSQVVRTEHDSIEAISWNCQGILEFFMS